MAAEHVIRDWWNALSETERYMQTKGMLGGEPTEVWDVEWDQLGVMQRALVARYYDALTGGAVTRLANAPPTRTLVRDVPKQFQRGIRHGLPVGTC